MRYIYKILFAFGVLILACSGRGNCQTGTYDTRFVFNGYDCNSEELYLDLQVKANSSSSIFNITLQNYKFTFNKGATPQILPPIANPESNPPDRSVHILEELDLSGLVSQDGNVSVFGDHTLVGSGDTVVSYNVPHIGGQGYTVNESNWTSVGRIRFSQLSEPECLNLVWQKNQIGTPTTLILGEFNSIPFVATPGVMNDFTACYSDYCGGALPIELTKFIGSEEGCNVRLDWETFSETQNDYFLIERSLAGDSFETLFRIEGGGTTQEASSYSFIDQDPHAVNYYRIRQVDYNGGTTTSETIIVSSSCFQSHEVVGISDMFPNPVMDNTLNVHINNNGANSRNVEFSLIDISGRQVKLERVDLNSGSSLLKIDVSTLSQGVYFIQFNGGDWFTQPQRVVKLN